MKKIVKKLSLKTHTVSKLNKQQLSNLFTGNMDENETNDCGNDTANCNSGDCNSGNCSFPVDSYPSHDCQSDDCYPDKSKPTG